MTKKVIFALVFCIALSCAAAQEAVNGNDLPQSENTEESVAEEPPRKKSTVFSMDFEKPDSLAGFGRQLHVTAAIAPTIMLSTGSSFQAMPYHILIPVKVGVFWQNNYFVSTEPSLSFFVNNYLWDAPSGNAFPSDLENRTALTFSFLLDFPAVFTLNVVKGSKLRIFAGVATLFRFGILSNGVLETDAGSSGTAASDLTAINKYFLNAANIVHLSLGAAWMFDSPTAKLQFGPEIKTYIPFTPQLNGMMISVALKLMF